MKKIISIFMMIFTIFILAVLNHSEGNQPLKKESISISKESPGRQFIILDSVQDPLPREAENVHYMEPTGGSQFLPNSQSKDPIIITKMPLPNVK